MDWELGVYRCKLVYIEWIKNKILLYSTRNYIQYLMISHNVKEYEKECVCVYIYMTQSLCYTAIMNNTVIQPYLNKILLQVNQEMLKQAS